MQNQSLQGIVLRLLSRTQPSALSRVPAFPQIEPLDATPDATPDAAQEGSYSVELVLLQVLVLAIGSMMMPTSILLVLSLLTSEHGRIRAVAFVSGVTAVRLLQGSTFDFFIAVTGVTHNTSEIETIVSTLLLVTGILMWAAALKQIYTEDEPNALLAKWTSLVTALTPVKASGVGVLLVATSGRAWLFTLGAIGVIGQAGLGVAQSSAAFLLYVLGAELLLVAPVLVTLCAPARFDALAQWLRANGRPITIAVSLIVGAFFLWHGARGLAG